MKNRFKNTEKQIKNGKERKRNNKFPLQNKIRKDENRKRNGRK